MRESVKAKGQVGLSLSKKLTPLNVGELGLEQGIKTAFLHEGIRKYISYRIAKSYGLKPKAPVTLVDLRKLQAEINKI